MFRRVPPIAALILPLFLVVWLGCKKPEPTPPAPEPSLPSAPAEETGPPIYEDVTAKSGVNFSYSNGETSAPNNLTILESLGGGVATIDYDGDGLFDLYFPGGGHFGGPDLKQVLGDTGRLYRNLGNFQFEDVTEKAGLNSLARGQPWFYSHAAAVTDYDRDGFSDLLVTGWGRVALFHNEPDGTGGRKFVDVSAAAGLDKGITWATSAGFADFDGDGFPDLFVCQYVDWSFQNHPTDCTYAGANQRDVCPPKRFKGLKDAVFRNTGDGKFQNVSETVGLVEGAMDACKGLGLVIADINGDGKPDVYVANDTVANQLYLNQSKPGTISFRELGMTAGVALDGGSHTNGSMGADAGDPDRAGQAWLFCTNYENELHALYHNRSLQKTQSAEERIFFLYATPGSGMAVLGQKNVGWGTGFVDLDRDGWEDLVINNGHAIRFPGPSMAPRRQKPILMMNHGEAKYKVASGRGGDYFRSDRLGRGLVLADLDNDGRIDAVFSNVNEPAAILKNISADQNHWLGVTLVGSKNADVVGARVRVTTADGVTQSRFAKGGGSYCSSPDRRLHLGLGTQSQIQKMTVTWPDGTTQNVAKTDVDKYTTINQILMR